MTLKIHLFDHAAETKRSANCHNNKITTLATVMAHLTNQAKLSWLMVAKVLILISNQELYRNTGHDLELPVIKIADECDKTIP